MTDILQKKEWNTKQVITTIVIAISITFSATMIWGRFLTVESAISILSSRLEKKDNRLHEKIDKLEKRVKYLEASNVNNGK